MMATAQEGPRQGSVAVGTVADGYRVERILSVRTGRHTLAEATAPAGERVLLQLAEAQPAEKGLRRRADRLAGVRHSIAHEHLLPLEGHDSDTGNLLWGSTPADAVTLADKLEGRPLELRWVVAVLSQVAGALETARRHGLVPRRLSPADILVSGEELPRALLADLGIGVPDVPACSYPFSVEDADYLSPEEILGAEPTPESCVYSLGCILVHCVTGAAPFPCERPLLTLYAHRVQEPPSLSERNERLPARLDHVVGRALSKEPRRRQQTPLAFMRAVQDALHVRAPMRVRSVGATRQEPTRAAAPASTPPIPKGAPRPTSTRRPAGHPERAKRAASGWPSARRTYGAPAGGQDGSPARAKRRAGRLRARRAALAWSSLALMASAVAGVAAGAGGTEPAAPAASTQAVQPAAEPAGPAVSPVVEQLQSRRAAWRRRLAEAKHPRDQLQAAQGLGRTYERAQENLRREPGVAHQEASLLGSLSDVEAAYRQLALAGSRRSRPDWQAARSSVEDSERDLDLLLRTERWR